MSYFIPMYSYVEFSDDADNAIDAGPGINYSPNDQLPLASAGASEGTEAGGQEAIDPTTPQEPVVDPTTEPEGGGDPVPFTVAALAMGPALAALGYRKRIRGKHVKL